MVRRITSVGLV